MRQVAVHFLVTVAHGVYAVVAVVGVVVLAAALVLVYDVAVLLAIDVVLDDSVDLGDVVCSVVLAVAVVFSLALDRPRSSRC